MIKKLTKKLIYYYIFFFNISLFSSNKFMLISIPKCGTMLVRNLLNLITQKGGVHFPLHSSNKTSFNFESGFGTSHELPTQKAINYCLKNNIKIIFVYRDPRDQIVSAAYFLLKTKNKRLISNFIWKLIFSSCKIWKTIYIGSIKNPKGNINQFYQQLLHWSKLPFVYNTSFEKLIGPNGGGNKEIQIKEIMNIANYIDHPITSERASEIASQLFGTGTTFREGKIGSWKKHFTPSQKEVFKKIAGKLLVNLNYENSIKDW